MLDMTQYIDGGRRGTASIVSAILEHYCNYQIPPHSISCLMEMGVMSFPAPKNIDKIPEGAALALLQLGLHAKPGEVEKTWWIQPLGMWYFDQSQRHFQSSRLKLLSNIFQYSSALDSESFFVYWDVADKIFPMATYRKLFKLMDCRTIDYPMISAVAPAPVTDHLCDNSIRIYVNPQPEKFDIQIASNIIRRYIDQASSNIIEGPQGFIIKADNTLRPFPDDRLGISKFYHMAGNVGETRLSYTLKPEFYHLAPGVKDRLYPVIDPGERKTVIGQKNTEKDHICVTGRFLINLYMTASKYIDTGTWDIDTACRDSRYEPDFDNTRDEMNNPDDNDTIEKEVTYCTRFTRNNETTHLFISRETVQRRKENAVEHNVNCTPDDEPVILLDINSQVLFITWPAQSVREQCTSFFVLTDADIEKLMTAKNSTFNE